jgi:hypothetical protein
LEERALLSYLEVVAFFDNIFELLQGGGNVLGAGGGFLAAALYRKLDVASKNAKNALAIAKRAEELVKNEVKVGIEAGMKEATRYVDEQLAKIARGSKVELSFDQETSSRLASLETRMSAIEDDLDARDVEDRKWQQEMQRSLGRIEGRLDPKIR